MKQKEPIKIDKALQDDLIKKVFNPLKSFFDERDAAQARLNNLDSKVTELEQQEETIANQFSHYLIESTNAIAEGRDVSKLQAKIQQLKAERQQTQELLKQIQEIAIPQAYKELKERKAALCNNVWASVNKIKPAYQEQVNKLVNEALDLAAQFEDILMAVCRQRGINLSEGVFLGSEKIHKLMSLVNQSRLTEYVRSRGW
jgi:DNA repair exonuclease SbcCD ATPase subunit